MRVRRHGWELKAQTDVAAATVELVEELWAEGEPLGLANDMLSGLQHFVPDLRGQLRQAWRLTRAWAQAEPPHRAAPASPLLVLAVAGFCRGLGQAGAAAMAACGFDAFLRTGELLGVRPAEVVIYSASRAVIRLERTKTSVRKNAKESVVVRSPIAVRLLREALPLVGALEPVVGLAPHSFRRLFGAVLRAFTLQDYGYGVYSLRRGGATWDFLRHGSMEQTLLRGRWASTATARIYVQDAAAEIASLRLSAAQQSFLAAAARLVL